MGFIDTFALIRGIQKVVVITGNAGARGIIIGAAGNFRETKSIYFYMATGTHFASSQIRRLGGAIFRLANSSIDLVII